MEVVVTKLPCPLEMIEVAVVELLVQYEEMAVAKVLVDQKEWQVHGPRVMTSVFDLIVYAASVMISAHLRKFCAGSTILSHPVLRSKLNSFLYKATNSEINNITSVYYNVS
jgi:hypothetical protein